MSLRDQIKTLRARTAHIKPKDFSYKTLLRNEGKKKNPLLALSEEEIESGIEDFRMNKDKSIAMYHLAKFK